MEGGGLGIGLEGRSLACSRSRRGLAGEEADVIPLPMLVIFVLGWLGVWVGWVAGWFAPFWIGA